MSERNASLVAATLEHDCLYGPPGALRARRDPTRAGTRLQHAVPGGLRALRPVRHPAHGRALPPQAHRAPPPGGRAVVGARLQGAAAVPAFRGRARTPRAVSFAGPGARRLRAKGVLLGEVVLVHTPMARQAVGLRDGLRHLHQFLCRVAEERGASPEEAVEDWWSQQVLAQLGSRSRRYRFALGELLDMYYYFIRDGGCPASPSEQDLADFTAILNDEFRDWQSIFCRGGFFCTVVMRVGRLTAQKGDRLVALSGSADPFLVRPVAPENGHELLGHCDGWRGRNKLTFSASSFSGRRLDEFVLI